MAYVGTKPVSVTVDVQMGKTVTPTGSIGSQTIHKNAGSINFGTGATSVVVTNSLVTSASILLCTVGTVDTTMKSVVCVVGSGVFTITPNAAPTAETRVNFLVIN